MLTFNIKRNQTSILWIVDLKFVTLFWKNYACLFSLISNTIESQIWLWKEGIFPSIFQPALDPKSMQQTAPGYSAHNGLPEGWNPLIDSSTKIVWKT